MNEEQIKKLAEKLRDHVTSDGSIYGFEEVIYHFLRQERLSHPNKVVSFFESQPTRKHRTIMG
jgi:hypothetical protein